MEETSSWRHPVDLPALLADVHAQLDEAIQEGGDRQKDWHDQLELAESVLDAAPQETLSLMMDLVRQGVPLTDLSATIAYAAARRPVHFRVTNEFSDWETVHHTFTYTNAVDQAMRRFPSNLLAPASAGSVRRRHVRLPGALPQCPQAGHAHAFRWGSVPPGPAGPV